MKTACIVTSVMLGLATIATAQEAKDADEQFKRLQYFVGAWDVTVKFRLPDGKDHEGKAAMETKSVLDGRFIHQEYKSRLGDEPLIVWQLLGYDTVQKKFVEFDLHAQGREMHTARSEGGFHGQALTLRGDSIDALSGQPVKLRRVTTILDENRYTLEWFFTDAGGKEERKVVLTHVRKK